MLFRSLFIFFMAFASVGQSVAKTEFTANCKLAYGALLNLEFKKLEKHLQNEREQNSENLFIPYFLHYADFVEYYVQPKAEGKEKLWQNLKAQEEKIIQNNSANPFWKNYFRAEIQLQQALIDLNEQNYISGFFKLRSVYLFSKEVVDKAVISHPAEKTLALTEALFSAVPDQYQWALKLLSIDVDLGKARKKLKVLSKNPMHYFRAECIMLSAALDLHLGGNAKIAYDLLQSENSPEKTPLFQKYLMANSANYAGMNDTALHILKSLDFEDFKRFPMLFYLRGKLLLQKLDPNAEKWFQYFLDYNKGEHLKKSSLQFMAWNALVHNDVNNFEKYRSQILKSGAQAVEADRAAQKMAESGLRPNEDLLKSRLLFDGGYYKKALEILQPENQNSSIEKNYRLGRIYDALGNYQQAILYYKKVIGSAALSGSYIPANTAYLLGQIYLEKQEYTIAKKHFEQVLEYEDHAYKLSLDQKAKAELRNLKHID